MLEVKNLSFKISNKSILKKIDFKAGKGEILGIVGANGSGKTTLMKIIMTLYPKYEGEIVNKANNFLGIIEDPGFHLTLTGRENIEYILHKKVNTETEHYLSLFKMNDYIDRPVKTYSQGMRQRLGLVIVLSSGSDLLIFDEPFNSLDKEATQVLISSLKKLKTDGISSIVSSHMIDNYANLYDNVLLLKNGKSIYLNYDKDSHYYNITFEHKVDISTIKGIENGFTKRFSANSFYIKLVTTPSSFLKQNVDLNITEFRKVEYAGMLLNDMYGTDNDE